MEVLRFQQFRKKIRDNIGKVIIGKEDNIDKIVTAFITSGHVLLEDVPGLGKTKLAKSLAKTMNCSFKRIQFTPDLLPSDLTGIYFYNQKDYEFEFRQGPLLSQIVLADEINRATPRTQSALLECMEERQITVEGHTIELNKPFFVIATQNPIEQFGTFPLPEAQLDRFFMKLSMGYPNYNEEKNMINRFMKSDPLNDLHSVITMEEIEYVQNNYSKVHVSEEIKEYILNIVIATRKHKSIELGCSPRATLNLMKGCQAYAAINGRDYVIPEDVKILAPSIMSHRIILRNEINIDDNKTEKLINDILNNIEAPLEKL
ncbi:AAA domain family protein [Clostridium argentinense CDC 2741]|uniref:AAA domain family protein n=1 Tax=Clostridium argentinense CDC 2741 TaxID=1418104 RepID=A0A0C1R3K5_9CLOT|nr:MoxR family ATPase [Clostridium argentinense]ARC84026.1 magnesium chelatase [Clostridium argentinense]KIE45041.1 AAA domain family protein [Clostridium argentinense CDC 2741]NFF39368.1 MoxR family ATPase [Clostridium argentinense]NFP50427.1 MoxR family ATPase [Clostridium argentinense]NFP73349.1 MoxR family ATPase [Clostridium argentinense]